MPFEPVLLRNIKKAGSETMGVYEQGGGYQALRKVIGSMTPEAVMEEVKKSGLRGRGGAGFPTGTKWSFMPKETPKPKYLVCNADESEPGTFKDRLLMEKDPHLLLEGCLISCYAMGSNRCFIYIRGEYVLAARVLEKAIAEAYQKGYAGANILGSAWSCELTLHVGAGAYICGEETALMESLEGKRGYPRLKPPFPASFGVFGCPTTINNVETLANVPFIIERGAAWFSSIGRERNTGPKLYCVSGHVKRPGVYEAALGIPWEELLNDLCGGMKDASRPLKAVIPGGSSVPVMTAEEMTGTLMDFDALAAKKTLLGSAGVIVMDTSVCMVKAIHNISRFYAHESCGQCTPCREGCGWMEKILRRVLDGGGKPSDPDLLLDVAGNITGNTICPLGDAAAWPVQSFVAKFRPEFVHHIENKTCDVAARAVAS
jgi:NADH-quinone oxidoreductase subunit F